MARSYRRWGLILASAALGVSVCVAATIAWLGRDEVLVHGSAYDFTIGMAKADVLGAYICTRGFRSPPVPPDLGPGGELARSDYWRWCLAGVPIDYHEFYFADGTLRKMLTKKRLFETM